MGWGAFEEEDPNLQIHSSSEFFCLAPVQNSMSVYFGIRMIYEVVRPTCMKRILLDICPLPSCKSPKKHLGI